MGLEADKTSPCFQAMTSWADDFALSSFYCDTRDNPAEVRKRPLGQ